MYTQIDGNNIVSLFAPNSSGKYQAKNVLNTKMNKGNKYAFHPILMSVKL
jgi:hypothetical protein